MILDVCISCSATLDPEAFEPLSDQWAICFDCLSDAVWTADGVEPYIEPCLLELEGLGLTNVAMPELVMTPASVMTGKYGWFRSLWDKDEQRIWMTAGISRRQLPAILAHEMTHAWRYGLGFRGVIGELEEGFALWTSWHIARLRGLDTTAVTIEQTRALGQRGFERLRVVEGAGGPKAAVQFAMTHQLLDLRDGLKMLRRTIVRNVTLPAPEATLELLRFLRIVRDELHQGPAWSCAPSTWATLVCWKSRRLTVRLATLQVLE